MRCQEVRSWTFKGLVAAFVDLSVAFSLLCASSLVYLSSNLLGLFGFNLPCPCDGLFSDPHKNKCFQETLGNLPVKKISSVQRSVMNTTPFDSILYKKANGECIRKKRKADPRHVEFEGEVSTTPTVVKVNSWVKKNASGFDLLTSQSLKKGSFKIKSKRLSFDRSPYDLRNHRQGHKNFPLSPANVMGYLNDGDENDPLLLNSKGRKTLEDVSLRKSVSLSSVECEAGAQNKQPERTFTWAGEGTCSSPLDITQKTIEILEQVVAEERAVRATLAAELEKERNAAASAADEALGMILRLQEEKASIEMEARQYQRMIEEKSAFDAEEMSILKEILLRREREKHVLEKEVETYRQMFLETEQPLLPNTPDSKSVIPGGYGNAGSPKTGEVDSDEEMKVNGVDQNTERDQSRSEGFDVHREGEREEGTSFQEAVSRCSESLLGVHDIHVVTDEDNKVEITRDLKLERSQSVADTTSYVNPRACLRRNSMSGVEYERVKIESEVGLLRGRLRALQKGRERLSFSSKAQAHQSLGDKTSRFWEATRSGPFHYSTSPSSTLVKAMSMTLDVHSA